MEVATQSTPFLLMRRRTGHACSLDARGLGPSLDRLYQHREGEGEYTLVVAGQPEGRQGRIPTTRSPMCSLLESMGKMRR
jgi:hypothetical protein